MPSADLTAYPGGRFDPSAPSNAPPLPGATERLYAAAPHATIARWIRGRLPAFSVSVFVHALIAMAFVYLWHRMVQDLTSPEPISVELVSSIPGEKPEKAGPKADPPPAEAQSPLQLPAAPPPVPPTPEKPAEPPVLLEVPAPRQAETQPVPTPAPNAATQTNPDSDKAAPPPPPEAPAIITAPQADESVPAPAEKPAQPKPDSQVDRAEPQQDELKAKLAAALPTDNIAMPSTFRSVLSSSGYSETQEYKGAVYAALNRLQGLATKAAKLGMKEGRIGLAITIASDGQLENIQVFQSTGKPAVDALIVGMVRNLGRFPPPPPGAARVMTPVLSFGAG